MKGNWIPVILARQWLQDIKVGFAAFLFGGMIGGSFAVCASVRHTHRTKSITGLGQA
jgi:hypothetical protein